MIDVNNFWEAPTISGSLKTTVPVPGSKSLTNRYLLLAALASEVCTIENPLVCRDTALMVSALSVLGAKVSEIKTSSVNTVWKVTPIPENFFVKPSSPDLEVKIFCGLAGTVMRFLPPLAALMQQKVCFYGDVYASKRPMQTTIAALRSLGIAVYDNDTNSLPFKIVGKGVCDGGAVTVDATSSSQFISALLLVGWRFKNGLQLKHVGGKFPSLAHVKMTVEVLKNLGISVVWDELNRWEVSASVLSGFATSIETDLSNAGPFLAAAMVGKGQVTIPNWPEKTTQPGGLLPQIFTRMGAKTSYVKKTLVSGDLTIWGGEKILGIDLDLQDAGELAPTVAAVAALATTESNLVGIAHLRGHESNRLFALVKEINNLGGNVVETQNGLRIFPKPLQGGCFDSYDDHRMATAGAIIGLQVPNVLIKNIATTQKTLTDFPAMWLRMLGKDGV